MNPFMRKSMWTLVMQPSVKALGQMQVKWQTFEKPKNKRQMYGSQAWVDPLPYICLLFSGFSNVCHSAAFWPTALKLGCITNFDMLSLVMGLNSIYADNSSHHCLHDCILALAIIYLYILFIYLIASSPKKYKRIHIIKGNKKWRQVVRQGIASFEIDYCYKHSYKINLI